MRETALELTAELIVDGMVPRNPAISPDGRWVAYVVTAIGRSEGYALDALRVVPTDGSTPPSQLTEGTARVLEGTARVTAPRWSADSAFLFFGSDQVERGELQLHRVSPSCGSAETVTAWKGGIADYLPLVEDSFVAVAAKAEPTDVDELRERERDDAKVWGDRAPCAELRLLDLGTGVFRVVGGLEGRHVVEMVQRPDGGPLAVLTRSTPELDPVHVATDLHLVDPGTGDVQHLGPVEMQARAPAWWSAHGEWHLTYLAVTPPGRVGGLAVFDLVPGSGLSGTHRNLTSGMTCCPSELAQVGHGPPLAVFADGLDTALYRLDPDDRRFRRVHSVDGFLGSLTASCSGAVAALASTAYEPHNVHAGPPAGPLIRLSDTRAKLRQVSWGSQERLSYRAADGLDLDGLLILPPGATRADGPFPLVTLIHGGPYDRYADQFMLNWYPSGQWLATGGCAVFLPNPRGGQGHGHEFAAMVAGAVGGDEWTDITSGIDMLVAAGIADPERLGIGGWSHGGFMSAWAVGQTGRFRAAVMGAGISDWGMLAATGEEGILEAGLGGSAGWEGVGPHRHDQLSPVSFASKIATPVLIVHGEDDTNVPLGQATYFHRALRHFGVEHEFVVYPREGHRIQERNHQLDLLRRVRTWFTRWLVTGA